VVVGRGGVVRDRFVVLREAMARVLYVGAGEGQGKIRYNGK
jgi:hypothetical protein